MKGDVFRVTKFLKDFSIVYWNFDFNDDGNWGNVVVGVSIVTKDKIDDAFLPKL